MKILLCNKFYYRRGGDCIYTMNLEQMLKAHGHEVAVFSQQFPLNEPSVWSKYWPKEFRMKPSSNMLDSLLRPFGLGSIKAKFEALLDDFFGPYTGEAQQYTDCIVHLNNIHTQLSPVIASLAHKRGIRVVWTIHDTKLVCPCYTCMRNGKWCEDCFKDKHAVLSHKCMTGGLLGSYIGYLEAKKWTSEKLQEITDIFLCPSNFMAQTMIKGGFNAEKIHTLSNFISTERVNSQVIEEQNCSISTNQTNTQSIRKQDYYIYVGRVNKVKGLHSLCLVASKLPYRLLIVGGGESEAELREQYKDSPQIEWLGQRQWDDFKPILEGARFMVLPSEWSENNPLTIIESLAVGTPVLGASIGGIPELIDEQNGQTFESGNLKSLQDGIKTMWQRLDFDYVSIAQQATARYGEQAYYSSLMKLYSSQG